MGKHQKTLRVLLVASHAAFRQALAVVLDTQPDLGAAAQAGSLAEARACLRSGGPVADVAVVDLGLPDGDGTDLVREIVEAEIGVAVLALADGPDLERHEMALGAGAGEVLTKGAGVGQILDTLRHLGGG